MEINNTETDETNEAEGEPPGRLRAGITYNIKKNIQSDLPDAEAEFDDAETIRTVQSALETAGFSVELYEATEDLPVRLLRSRPDIVFNIAEGFTGRGREAQVPAVLNFLGIPFTGSDETTLCIAMDKALCKRIVASCGVSTPDYLLIKSNTPLSDTGLSFPVIVKPNTEGSGKGISGLSIAADAAALRRILAEKIAAYKQDMLIEEYISGREFTVGILGNGDDLRVFPPMEIIFNDRTQGIYSYEVKRNFRQYVQYKCPADISAALRSEIEAAALTVYRALECRDMARMDFRLSPGGRLYFIEINPLPGLAPGYSDFPMLAASCFIDHAALIRNIMDSALVRYDLKCRILNPSKRIMRDRYYE